MPSVSTFLRLASLIAVAVAVPSKTSTAKRATCTVNSVASAASLGDCTDVVIEAFTVPSGETLTIAAAEGATVTMTGDVTFAKTTGKQASKAGPLFILDTASIVFNGGDHNINGNGADYWDGQGTNGGVAKPHPFVKFLGSGTFEDVTVLNSPAQAISVGTNGAATITNVNVNNGNAVAGNSLGANTDGFDVEGDDITIVGGTVTNQDDCVAINGGDGIVIDQLTCIGSHGISIGSIATGKSVTNVKIGNNVITGGLYGLRIKVDADATDASVSDITYEGNTISGITEYGVLITQSYPDNDSTPGTGAPISGITFSGATTTVSVDSDAHTLVVDCGACSGTWDFASLDATGGLGHIIDSQDATIEGGTY
ncbi:polygalacturonase [Mycena sanguinolenta]|nr:polygalacturonase [Mycena sanguinolenta]